MKKILKYGVMALMVVLPLLSFASEFRAGENSSLGSAEKIADDVYMAGANVTSAGAVDGDLFVAGGNVVVSGDVFSDLMVAGSNLNILSPVGDDARVFGGTVLINGKIKGDLLIGGGQVTISGEGVGKDATIGGGNVHINAPISGDLLLGGGNVYINAPIGGNVKIQAEKITLGKNAVISGDLSYKSKKELVQEEGSVIKGAINFEPIQRKEVSKDKALSFLPFALMWKFLTVLVCALLLGLIFKRFSREVVNTSLRKPLLEIGRGFLTMIALPILSILLFMTLVGVPFGVIGLLSIVALSIFSCLFAPIVLGGIFYRLILRKEPEVTWKSILIGSVLNIVFFVIPFVGWLISLLVMFLTLGSIVTLKLEIIKDWR